MKGDNAAFLFVVVVCKLISCKRRSRSEISSRISKNAPAACVFVYVFYR